MQDLRTYLDSVRDEVLHIRKEVDPLTQMGALCSESEQPIVFENIKGYPGWRVCDRIISNRAMQAVVLGVDPKRVVPELARRLSQGPGEIRTAESAPCKEQIWLGKEADLLRLPIAIHSEGDARLFNPYGIMPVDSERCRNARGELRTGHSGEREVGWAGPQRRGGQPFLPGDLREPRDKRGHRTVEVGGDIGGPEAHLDRASLVFEREAAGRAAGIRREDHRRDAEVLGVIGDDEKIQGRFDLDPSAMVGVDHGQALRVAVRGDGVRRHVAVQVRVEGVAAVEMRVAPEELLVFGPRTGSTEYKP